MFAKVLSAGLIGIDAYVIDVEVDIQNNAMPAWALVGLPDSEVKECRERVISAIKNSGYDFIYRKVIVNLAPADTKKQGTALDLPIAIGLMTASSLLSSGRLVDTMIVGELSLTGELRPISGLLPIAILAREKNLARLIVPKDNACEAAMVKGLNVYGFETLSDVLEFLRRKQADEV